MYNEQLASPIGNGSQVVQQADFGQWDCWSFGPKHIPTKGSYCRYRSVWRMVSTVELQNLNKSAFLYLRLKKEIGQQIPASLFPNQHNFVDFNAITKSWLLSSKVPPPGKSIRS
jgi:hypothetical protein